MPNNKYFSVEYFNFFIELASNNHKEWFDANKKRYEEFVKNPFENFVQSMLTSMSKIDKKFENILAKDCIFRINRDIRFSKDKTPYKINRSALLNPNGRKDMGPAGVYIEIGPETCAIYAGMYMIEKDELQKLRNYFLKNYKIFSEIISEKKFKKWYGGIQGEEQKKLAPEYKELAEKFPLMYKKQLYVSHQFEPEITLEKDIIKYCTEAFEIVKPLNEFFVKAINKK